MMDTRQLGIYSFSARKKSLEDHLERLKVYFAAQKLLPEEKRQFHYRKIEWMDASIQDTEQEIADLIAYTRRPFWELEYEAHFELAEAIRSENELSLIYREIPRNQLLESSNRVGRARKHLEHLQELKLSPL